MRALPPPRPASPVFRTIGLALALAGPHCAHGADTPDYLDAPDRIQWQAGALYDGRFDDGTPFLLELAYPRPTALPADAAAGFGGAVWQPRQYSGTPSPLRATADPGGQIRLAMADEPGAAGDATYTVTLAPDRATGQGVLSGPEGAAPRNFTLRRSVPYVGVVVTRPAPADLAEFSSYYREKGFTFSAVFPVVGNPEADHWIRQQAGICKDTGECANTVRIVWRSASLLSLKALAWGDSGGAHGIGYAQTRQYGIADGAMTPLDLDAFIAADAACREQVRTAIVAGLRARGMSWADKATLDASRNIRFTPTPDGLAFHFDPYEVGPYAEGAPSVFVPRTAIGPCAKALPAAD